MHFTSPSYRPDKNFRYQHPYRRLNSGSYSISGSNSSFSRKAIQSPVSGISCISPMAPTGERALGSKLDSVRTSAATRAGSRSLCRAWATIRSLYLRG